MPMTIDKAKIVVIILTINQREMVLQSLASLMALEELPFEVLLWDNGSKDGTVEAVHDTFPTVFSVSCMQR